MIQRKRVCQNCKTDFITAQHSAKYCSPTCRTKARSSKTASNRIEKLPHADNWLWIVRECRRAGTVEILNDVDLEQLFEIYNRRYKCYGYNPETRQSKFHLCHISPIAGTDSIGLLHHENLFIGGSLANQKHGAKAYPRAGRSISKSSLKKKWRVSEEQGNKAVLKKVQEYLGAKLIEYAKNNPIKKAQRFVIAARIAKLPNNTTPLAELERMGTNALRELEARLNFTTAYTIDLKPKRSLAVYLEELERFAGYDSERKDDFLFVADAVRLVAQYLAQTERQSDGLRDITATSFRWFSKFKPLSLKPDKDISKLRDFVSFTAFETLQGASVGRELITATFRSYLQVEAITTVELESPDLDSFEYSREEDSEYRQNVTKVVSAMHLLGLVDRNALRRIVENSQVRSFNADRQCDEYWLYELSSIQVEEVTHNQTAPMTLPF